MAEPKTRATAIAVFLEGLGAREAAAKTAGKAIATAWAEHDFMAGGTRPPLEKCLLDSPEITADQVLDLLVRAFGVHVHNVPEWEHPR
jgi:hypothetical protein